MGTTAHAPGGRPQRPATSHGRDREDSHSRPVGGGPATALEIRTAAGPSSAVQCVFNGGPYTTASQVRQCQLVWPPLPCPRQATCPTRTWLAPSGCLLGIASAGG